MNIQNERKNIIFICDNGYAMPTGVAIYSLIQNKKPQDFFHIYILCENVSENYIETFIALGKEDVTIEILKMNESYKYRDFVIEGFHVSPAAAYKFDLPVLFPDIDKALYIDGDVLIQKDISKLYDTNITDKYAAVVKDIKGCSFKGDFRERLKINHTSYFNSGVLLLNLKKLREDNISEKLYDYRKNGINLYMDQDAFNVIFSENIEYISFLNNATYTNLLPYSIEELIEMYELDNNKYISKEDICNDAVILHFSSQRKPWQFFDIPCGNRWMQYYMNSPFGKVLLKREYTNENIKYWPMNFSEHDRKLWSPKISVIMPVYNSQRFLLETLDSVVMQSFSDFELICVDDGSSDESVNILYEYAAKDSRIKILKQKNQYAGIARNNGIACATGKYITFIDSDDKFTLDALEKLYQKAMETDADVVIAETKAWDALTGKISKGNWGLREQYRPKKEIFSVKDIPQYIFNISSGNPWGKLFKTNFIRNNNIEFLDLKRSEDFYFVYLAFVKAERIAACDAQIIYYRVNNYGGLESTKGDALLLFWEADKRLKDILIQEKLFDGKIKQSFINTVINQFNYNLNNARTKTEYTRIISLLKDIYDTELELTKHSSDYFFTANINNFFNQIVSNKYPFHLIDDSKLIYLPLNETIKVSVIIPVFNTDSYLYEAVLSIMNQTLKDIEIICVNDGSTDNSLSILMELSKKDSRIIIINQENGGQSRARNRGLLEARGEYVYFFDSDDILDINALEKVYEYSKKYSLDLCIFDGKTFYENEKLKKEFPTYQNAYIRKHNYYGCYLGEDLFSDMHRNGDYTVQPCLQFFSREFLKKTSIKFREGIFHEDNLFSLQAILFAKNAGYISEAFFNRRVRANSTITKKNNLTDFVGLYTCLVAMICFIQENDFKQETMDNLKLYMQKFYFSVYNRLTKLDDKQRTEVTFLDDKERFISGIIFCSFSNGASMQNTNTGNCSNISSTDVKRLQKQMEDLKNSKSFRIGRIITFIPRKIRGGIRCYKDHGLKYTMKRTLEHLGVPMGIELQKK